MARLVAPALGGMALVGLITAPVVSPAAAQPALNDDRSRPSGGSYDFSRWEVSSRALAVLPGASSHAYNGASHVLDLGAGPETSSGLLLPPSAPARPASVSFDLSDLGLTPPSANLNMINAGPYAFGPSAGFMGGIDVSTVLFYSSGAVIGLVGANLKLDENKSYLSGPNTSYLQDPANFQTTEFNNQYGLTKINAHFAYARGHNGDGVLVSVMDTPFNTSHANLQGAFVDGYNPADGTTNVALDCNNASNPCKHGTHVAGIIGARKTDGATSMHGVAYNVKIKPIAFLGSGITLGSQQVTAFEKASGIDNATGKQIVAMNNSWGPAAGTHSQTYNGKYFKVPSQSSIPSNSSIYLGSRAAAEADTIMVFAAGNDGWNSETGKIYLYDSEDSDTPTAYAYASDIVADSSISLSNANRVDTTTAMPVHAPDTTPYVIDSEENEHMWLVVVATDDNNTITSFSNGCGDAKNFCLAAPGDDIKSTNGLNSTPYIDLPGTSMAAPHVTGAIAVLADMYPNLLDNPENISQILLETATDLGATGVDDVYGHGLLNLQKATGPLGEINIADSSSGASGSVYSGGATIETPVAFGDALLNAPVMIGGMDKYDRVFMLNLPVASLDMSATSMAAKAERSLVSSASDDELVAGLSFQGGSDDGDNVINAGVNFGAVTSAGKMKASLTMNMTPEKPEAGLNGDAGYTRYFNAMAYAGETTERMALDMQSHQDARGKMVSSRVQLDRDADQKMTFISETTAIKALGPLMGRFTLGGVTEEGRMLGADLSGPLAVSSTHTMFAKAGVNLTLGRFGQIDGYYELGRSTRSFVHDDLVSSSAIMSDTYGVSYRVNPRAGEELFVTLRRPVAITDGQMRFNTLTGYTADGDYRRGTLTYGIAPEKRETEMLAEYRREFFPGNMLALGVNHQAHAYNMAGLRNTGGYLRSEWEF
ncbi:MAG: S8 family serine peptidase [Alphaproteobacteria bacterium]|nr:S8 family serine peptidase [Alphaproteobacteria bacterium]